MDLNDAKLLDLHFELAALGIRDHNLKHDFLSELPPNLKKTATRIFKPNILSEAKKAGFPRTLLKPSRYVRGGIVFGKIHRARGKEGKKYSVDKTAELVLRSHNCLDRLRKANNRIREIERQINDDKSNRLLNEELDFLQVLKWQIYIYSLDVFGDDPTIQELWAGSDKTELHEKNSKSQTQASQFKTLVKEALAAERQTESELWSLKKQFESFPDSYFNRYAYGLESFQDGAGSGNGLEWRRNPKFRKPRSKKRDL